MLCFLFLLFCLFLKSMSFMSIFYYSILFHVICFLLFCSFLKSMPFKSILCHSIHATLSVHFLSLCLLCLSHVIQYIPRYLCFKSMCFCVYLMLFNTFYVICFLYSACFFSLCLFMSIFCYLIHCLFVPPFPLISFFLFFSFSLSIFVPFIIVCIYFSSAPLFRLYTYFCGLAVLCWIEHFI